MSKERKTATAVLLKKSETDEGGWRLQTFGDSAETEYLEAKMNSEGSKHLALFKYFKMELYRGGRRGQGGRKVDDVMADAVDGRVTLPLVYVVSLALAHIKAQIMDSLNKADHVTLRTSDIRFVLTIPAIWSEFGKIFMRTAACRGGLTEYEHDHEVWFGTSSRVGTAEEADGRERNREGKDILRTEGHTPYFPNFAFQRLTLCLEPEAACLSVEADDAQPWEEGTQVMVLDCGGGTIDITAHEVIKASPLELKEVEEPTGGPWGSTIVDAKFKAFL
ncbi:unnamed protein product, partial [Sphacelaria rigidula]